MSDFKAKMHQNRFRGKSAQFELPRKFTKLTYNDSISD